MEAEVTEMRPGSLQAYHGIQDHEKLEALIESMERDGWQGVPLVRVGESWLITGSHRVVAARNAELETVPTVEIMDLFAEAGLDFAAIHAEYGEPVYGEWALSDMIARELPDSIKTKYGVDIDA